MPLIAQVGLGGESVMISSNGAVVRGFDGELLDRSFLPVETARRLCIAMRSYGTLVFTFDRDGAGCMVIESLQQLHARIDRWVEANRPYLAEVQPLEGAFEHSEEPIQGMVCGTVAEMLAAEQQLLLTDLGAQVAMHRTEYPARNLSILDLLPLGCSKGAALDGVARLRGLTRNEIMAIGDNLNDLEMLEYAGRAVVMANANSAVLDLARDRGWELTASNDDDGVALAVEELLRRQAGMQDAGGNSDQEAAGSPVVEFAQ
jgi:HAD superfamily hydrolase (TIGR01484 family)